MIDKYVIMPNHIHMIIINSAIIGAMETGEQKTGAPKTAPPTGMNIPKLMNSFKSIVTKQIGYSIWQRNYYERIIRDDKEYYNICEYIQQNPLKWIQNHPVGDALLGVPDPNDQPKI